MRLFLSIFLQRVPSSHSKLILKLLTTDTHTKCFLEPSELVAASKAPIKNHVARLKVEQKSSSHRFAEIRTYAILPGATPATCGPGLIALPLHIIGAVCVYFFHSV